ncbi:MAG: exodeoxyribonuclease VII large subunit [Ruminococcaceae bacterium]|nr:exodeoxyribonuclease VII large subunit [Oscillospiraceae bacterium]
MNISNNNTALSVTAVNGYIKALINSDEILSSIAVRGEISNFKRHSAGHLYFTLKDDGAEISAVMFRGDAQRMNFNPADGMRVVIYGSIDVYEKSGRYQLYARTMVSDGIGAMAEAFERLKKKLEAEGLFAEERKRPLPKFPQRIGVITAPTGAAIRDILNITGRRYPQAEIRIYPSLVQGADAPASLCTGMEYLNAEGLCDVIIIGRGGGSVEDLWAFNDEILARTVAASKIPVISAVGHETDFTLCDFAADKRAPTPSAAAELAVPDRGALSDFVAGGERSLNTAIENILRNKSNVLESRNQALMARSPESRLMRMRDNISNGEKRLHTAIENIYGKNVSLYDGLVKRLDALNPLSVLNRGYSAVKNSDGGIVGRVEDMAIGQTVTLIMADGSAKAEIVSIDKRR